MLQAFGYKPDETPAGLRLNAGEQLRVADDYAAGAVLADQTAGDVVDGGEVLTFTFSEPVAPWVYAADPADLDADGEIRVDPFGGSPSASLGIPVRYGAGYPLQVETLTVRVWAPAGVRVTAWGPARA